LPHPVWFLLLSHRLPGTPIWTVDELIARLPGFHQAPLLCAARTFLERWRTITRDHPFALAIRLSTCGRPRRAAESRCRRGDLNSHGFPHYALNVARLPIPPLRRGISSRLFAGWSRPGDSNPRPALYERAALPTELGRRVRVARLLILSARYLISNPGSLSTSSHIVRFPAFFGSFSGQGLW
jgi:hypothetical protein